MLLDHEAEWQTRLGRVDPRLRADGWSVVPFDPDRPLASYTHHAIREYPTAAGPAGSRPHDAIDVVALQTQPPLVRVSTPEARQRRVVRLLDAGAGPMQLPISGHPLSMPHPVLLSRPGGGRATP